MASYVINSQHRDGNPNKSQWTLSKTGECSLFNTANSSGWLDFSSKKGFGINKTGAILDQLGVWTDRVTVLKIAKFVGDHQDEWHGYPLNYRKNQHDKPTVGVLNLWLKSGLISKPDMARIKTGKQCNL
jgi:hypothetical protein